jgi:hypothetical protein
MNKDLHLPLEAGDELPLSRVETRNVIDLRPAALLLTRTGRKILLVTKCRGEVI